MRYNFYQNCFLELAEKLALVFTLTFSQINCEEYLQILDKRHLHLVHQKIPAIEPPAFEAAPAPVNFTISEITSIVVPILKSRLKECLYDRSNIWKQFLLHLEKINSCEISALNSFFPDFDISKQKGSACVGMTIDLIEHIPNHFNAYLVGAKLPAKFEQNLFPYYCHTAVAISYLDPIISGNRGYILLDPAFDIPYPIILNSNQNQQLVDMKEKGKWLFKLQLEGSQDVIICYTNPTDLNNLATQMIYRTDRFANPIQASALPMFLADKKPTLLSRDEEGNHYAHLNLELKRKAILVSINYERKDPISFNDFISKNCVFNESFSKLFGMSSTDLNKYFEFLIFNSATILNIQSQYEKIIHSINLEEKSCNFSFNEAITPAS